MFLRDRPWRTLFRLRRLRRWPARALGAGGGRILLHRRMVLVKKLVLLVGGPHRVNELRTDRLALLQQLQNPVRSEGQCSAQAGGQARSAPSPARMSPSPALQASLRVAGAGLITLHERVRAAGSALTSGGSAPPSAGREAGRASAPSGTSWGQSACGAGRSWFSPAAGCRLRRSPPFVVLLQVQGSKLFVLKKKRAGKRKFRATGVDRSIWGGCGMARQTTLRAGT
jgi:hypothetical protein